MQLIRNQQVVSSSLITSSKELRRFRRSFLIEKCKKTIDTAGQIWYDNNARGISAVGSAQHWQCWGQGFESPMLHQKNSDLKTSRSFSVLFAFGEFDCFAVICGYRRVIFASRVLGRIEYHCERSEQYHFCESKNFTPSNARHITLLHFRFLNPIGVIICLRLFRLHKPTKRVGNRLPVLSVVGIRTREADEATSEAMAKRCKHRKNPLC